MTPEMKAFLEDLIEVLEKHKGGLTYTRDDDGLHATVGDQALQPIGWIDNGDCEDIRKLIAESSMKKKKKRKPTSCLDPDARCTCAGNNSWGCLFHGHPSTHGKPFPID